MSLWSTTAWSGVAEDASRLGWRERIADQRAVMPHAVAIRESLCSTYARALEIKQGVANRL